MKLKKIIVKKNYQTEKKNST